LKNWRQAELEDILSQLEVKDIVLLTGVRGSGKTTLLRSLAERYVGEKGDAASVKYIDLEDPRLAPGPSRSSLNLFSAEYEGQRSGAEKLVLLDEVSHVQSWRAWAGQQVLKNGIKLVATSSCVPGEYTGRSGTGNGASKPGRIGEIHLLPLGLRAYLQEFTDKSVDNESARQGLLAYLKRGGLPVAWSAPDYRRKLVDNFYMSLVHDVLLKNEIRDAKRLTAMAVYLVSATSEEVSASHLKGLVSKSVDQARAFLSHLKSSGLVCLAERIEDRSRDIPRSARRCFAADSGLAAALSTRPENTQVLVETVVFNEILRLGHLPYAVKARGCLGLAVPSGAQEKGFCVWVDFKPRRSADPRPLAAAMSAYGFRSGLLLTAEDEAGELEVRGGSIRVRAAWQWLLDAREPAAMEEVQLESPFGDRIYDEAEPKPAGAQDSAKDDSLPPHLL